MLLAIPEESLADLANFSAVDEAVETSLKRLRIRIARTEDETSSLARLYTDTEGFILKVRARVAQETFRFLVAHEMAHTLSYTEGAGRPTRLVTNGRMEEIACDEIARHVLIPGAVAPAVSSAACLQTCAATLVDMAMRWRIAAWQVLRRAYRERSIGSLTGILWKVGSDETAYVIDAVSPRGLFVPRKARRHQRDCMKSTLWDLGASSAATTGEERVEDVRVGSLNGPFRTAYFRGGPRGLVGQLVALDEAHVEKARAWRQRHPTPASRRMFAWQDLAEHE